MRHETLDVPLMELAAAPPVRIIMSWAEPGRENEDVRAIRRRTTSRRIRGSDAGAHM